MLSRSRCESLLKVNVILLDDQHFVIEIPYFPPKASLHEFIRDQTIPKDFKTSKNLMKFVAQLVAAIAFLHNLRFIHKNISTKVCEI